LHDQHRIINVARPSRQGDILLGMLEALLPVRFQSSTGSAIGSCDAVIFENGERNDGTVPGVRLPTLCIPFAKDAGRPGPLEKLQIKFEDDSDVPFPFRGRSLVGRIGSKPQTMALRAGEKPLASTAQGIVWAASVEDRPRYFRSGFPLPSLTTESCFFDVFNSQQFFEVLPLLHFLHHVIKADRQIGPPLRACFIIDDPNLHWVRYGFVDFKKIAASAAKENYHVSFATIPIDSWFAHQAASGVFKRSPDRISLLVHGNNHTHAELAQNSTEREQVSLLRQAIQRVKRLENVTGLHVSRVMAPPHGACSESMLEQLPRCGFEAVTVSYGSLRKYNRTKSWVRNLGYRPLEVVQNCPVLPRFGLNGRTENTILLAAYLRQPIILMGHHQDLRDGYDVLTRSARLINGLGPVSWGSMSDICGTTYDQRIEGDEMALTVFFNSTTIILPGSLRSLTIQDGTGLRSRWRLSGRHGLIANLDLPATLQVTDQFGDMIHCERLTPPLTASDPGDIRPSLAASVRRLITETRDRLAVLR
jgi:hypothetical protein